MKPIIVDVLGVIKNSWSYPQKKLPPKLDAAGEF